MIELLQRARLMAEWQRRVHGFRDKQLIATADMMVELADEVERLEARNKELDDWQMQAMRKHHDLLPELTPEQRDAIDRMDVVVDRMLEECRQRDAEFARLRAENAKARELLREIADHHIPFGMIHERIKELLKDE